MIRIGVVGLEGKMAKLLMKEIDADSGCILSGTYGRDTASVSGLSDLFKISDIVIDFTTPEVSLKCLEYTNGKTYICGTTGIKDSDLPRFKEAGKNAKILLSSNMSFGMLVMQYALKKIVPLLSGFDVEILEKHHSEKIDSPSGTSLSLAKNITQIKNIDFDKSVVFNRFGNDTARKADEIGIASIRGGTVAGDHTVCFLGDKESIEITHRAESRDIFAIGAIRIAKMLYKNKDNGFFDMEFIINNIINGVS